MLNCSNLILTKPYPNSSINNGVAISYILNNNLKYNLDIYFVNQSGFPSFISQVNPTSSIKITAWPAATVVFNIQLLSQIIVTVFGTTSLNITASSISSAYCYNLLNDVLIPKIDSSNNNICSDFIAYKPYTISTSSQGGLNVTINNFLNYTFGMYYINSNSIVSLITSLPPSSSTFLQGFIGASLVLFNNQLFQSIPVLMGNKYMSASGIVLNISSIPTVYCYNILNDLSTTTKQVQTAITTTLLTTKVTSTTGKIKY